MLLNAIKINEKYQKKNKLKKYTKPELFHNIERFMLSKKLIGYGGMAINILLPTEKQFYEYIDVPDYDFFSPNAKRDAVELSKILSNTYDEIEVKSAINEGTFKIFVNFIPIVDITQIDYELYKNLLSNSVYNKGIYYAPYNYLRMSMYLELSRPLGDISRWEKVYKRLQLLNQSHPLILRHIILDNEVEIKDKEIFNDFFKKIMNKLKDNVFLGNYAMYYYQHLFPKKYQIEQQSKVFILTEEPMKIISKIKKIIHSKNLTINTKKYENKFITFDEVYLENIPCIYLIKTDSCQSYNVVDGYNIASIDTMLSVYYAMSFFNNIEGISKSQLLSYCYLLHTIENKGESNQNDGVLRRFNMPCIGTQLTFEDIKQEKNKKYKIYKKTGKYSDLFFRFDPKREKTKKLKKN
jgi:hypothetical protein